MSRAVAGTVLAAVAVALLSAAPRVLLASGTLPELLRPFIWSDALLTYERGLSGHRLPYRDSPFEYPPLVGAFSGLLSLASSDATLYVLLWGLVVAAFAGAGAAVLARAAGPRRTLAYWSLAPQLLLLGGVNFDVLATALLVVAAVAQRSGRELAAMLGLAAGTATKLFPLASVPVTLLGGQRRIAASAVFLATLLAFYLPTLPLPYSSAGGIGRYAASIGANIDSVWGLAERGLAALGVPDAALVIVVVTTTGVVATYLLHVLPHARRASDPVLSFGLATTVLLFWSRLYSPQYSLWLLPFFVLLPLSGRRFALLTAADIGVFVTVYPLTLVRRSPDDATSIALLGALAAFVTLRQVAIVAVWRALARAG